MLQDTPPAQLKFVTQVFLKKVTSLVAWGNTQRIKFTEKMLYTKTFIANK